MGSSGTITLSGCDEFALTRPPTAAWVSPMTPRSEEHTSELQSRQYLVCRLMLEKKKLLRRITRTENILHRNFTRRQVAIQNRVASNIGISQSTFSVKVLNLFSRSRRKTNKRKSKHSAMLRNKESFF